MGWVMKTMFKLPKRTNHVALELYFFVQNLTYTLYFPKQQKLNLDLDKGRQGYLKYLGGLATEVKIGTTEEKDIERRKKIQLCSCANRILY